MALVRMPLADTGQRLIAQGTFEAGRTIRRDVRQSADGTKYVRLGDFAYNGTERNAYVKLDYFVSTFCTSYEIREA